MKNITPESKRQKISEGLKLFYMTAGEMRPPDFNELLNMWCDLLADVQESLIEQSFKLALKTNNKFKIPRISQVVEASRNVSRSMIGKTDLPNPKDSQVIDDMVYTSGAYYTGMNLPWIYWPDQMRDILNRDKEKNITPAEAQELTKFMNQRFYPENLRLNNKSMYGLELPTKQQHINCIKVVTATLEGKCDIKEGMNWIDKILTGK